MQAIKEELDQIVKNETWKLVPRPKDKNIIGTMWVLINKMNEKGEVLRTRSNFFSKVTHSRKE